MVGADAETGIEGLEAARLGVCLASKRVIASSLRPAGRSSARADVAGLDALAPEDERHGSKQQPDVAPKRPVRDVEVVELHHLVDRDAR